MIAEDREAFEREYGCTEAEWRGWLPAAADGCTIAWPAPGQAVVDLGAGAGGTLELTWTVLAPRRIALLALPRLAVRFRFRATGVETRRTFMRRFDLHLQRGGG